MLSCRLARLWFFSFVVLLQIAISAALSYTRVPQNVTQHTGKAASFLCAVAPETASTTVAFTLHRRDGNYSVRCPGERTDLPSKGLKGYCELGGGELRAVWSLAYSSRRDSGTYVACRPVGLSPAYAYLTVTENRGYFSALIGCVVGGFAGTLLVFGLAYLGLRRSESCRRCFKGRMNQDDMSTIIEQ